MASSPEFLFSTDYGLVANNNDPVDQQVGFYGIPEEIPYIYTAPNGRNPPPIYGTTEDSSDMVWSTKDCPSGILRAYGIASADGEYRSTRTWIGDRKRGTEKDNAYLLQLDCLLARSC